MTNQVIISLSLKLVAQSVEVTTCHLCLCSGDELSGVLDKDMRLLWQVLSDDSDADLRCRALAVWNWVSLDCTVWCPGSTYDDSMVNVSFWRSPRHWL